MLTRGVDIGTVPKVGAWKDPTTVLGIYHELIDDVARAAVELVRGVQQSRSYLDALGVGKKARKSRKV